MKTLSVKSSMGIERQYHLFMRSIKTRGDFITKLLLLFLSGILAHTLSGGEVVAFKQTFLLTAVISLGLFIARNITLEGPQLALMVLLAQSFGHFLLGGADNSSDLQMSAAHIFAGVLSYRAVIHLNKFWNLIADLVARLQIPRFNLITFQNNYVVSQWPRPNLFISHLSYSSLQFRGPPVKEFA
jgi:hypothetical protein